MIVWAYAFILTSAGVYTYNGCSVHVPVSNIISEACRKHAFTMMHCRTDVSTALKTMAWFRFPYPFQWGMPTFQWKTISVMMVASVIASIDSVRAHFDIYLYTYMYLFLAITQGSVFLSRFLFLALCFVQFLYFCVIMFPSVKQLWWAWGLLVIGPKPD